jgi:histidinol-phosphate aminotransferase
MAGVMTPALEPLAVHGGPDYAELESLGIRPEELLDFSVNTNPAPIPAGLRQVIATADVTTYPDSECLRLRQAAAEAYGVTPAQVLAGNGSSELIWLVCLAFVQPGDAVLVRQPSFGEYARAARIFRAEPLGYAQPLPDRPAKLALICNPNNPTGDLAPVSAIHELAGRTLETLFVVDEAYADFVEGRPTAIRGDMPENLLVLRSLTKFSALAGLRLGLAVGQPPLIERLRAVKPPWNVSAVAQAAGEYALRHPELLPDVEALAAAKAELVKGLRRLGLESRPSACNFFLVQVGDARAVRQRLLRRGCLVRDCSSFGLPDCIRIAVRTPEQNQQLLAALAQAL